jgi:hypothetical protein
VIGLDLRLAPHKGIVDELATWLCNKAKVSHG